MNKLETLLCMLKNEYKGMIREGITRDLEFWNHKPDYMLRTIRYFTQPALYEAMRQLEKNGCNQLESGEWAELAHIMCDRIQEPRFRRKLKKHRQFADAVSFRCVRMLDQMIRFLEADQRFDEDRYQDDAQKTTK